MSSNQELSVPPAEPSAAIQGRIPQLDGLRALAVLAVFVNHSLRVPLAWVGVDAFFVLSGFLITGILLEAEASPAGYFIPFYRRRFVRILPPYVLTLIVYHFVYHLNDFHPWPLYAFFGMNLRPFFPGLGPGDLPLWSLAVEEQFYLIWPFIVLLASEKLLMRLTLAAIIIVPLLRVVCTPWLNDEFAIYTLTPFRIDMLCAGAALTLLWKSRTPSMEHRLHRHAWMGCLGGFGALALLQIWPNFRLSSNKPLANGLCYSLSLFGAVSLLAWTLADKGWLRRFLSSAPMRFIGRISYTMYLVHVMVLVQLARFIPFRYLTPVGLALTVAYATVSWYLMERPLLVVASRSTSRRHLRY